MINHTSIETLEYARVTDEYLEKLRAPLSRRQLLLKRVPWIILVSPLAVFLGVNLGWFAFSAVRSLHVSARTDAPVRSVAHESGNPGNAFLPPDPVPPPVHVPPNEISETKMESPHAPKASATAVRQGKTNGFQSLLGRGWRFYKGGEFQKSAVLFARAVRSRPSQASAYFGLALSLFEQGHESEALGVLEQGFHRKGKKGDLWVLAGSIYQWMGWETAARDAYKRYLKETPHGNFSGDVGSLLGREHLPRLLPYESAVQNMHDP